MRLECGWIFLWQPERNRFRLAVALGLPESIQEDLWSPGEPWCVCQRSLLSESSGTSILRHKCNRLSVSGDQADDHFHLTLPLVARDQRLGVMNLRCRREHEACGEETKLLATIGGHVSEAVANARLHATLREKEAARLMLLETLVTAQEQERARLARELHDGFGQSLTSLLVQLKRVQTRADQGPIRERIAGLCQEVSSTIEEIGQISHRLRPAALEELGLQVALQTLAEEITGNAGLQLAFQSNLSTRHRSEQVEIALYRIAQEALTNVVRHAEAQEVDLELVEMPYALCLRIEDDGRGFDPDEVSERGGADRLGLIGMQERAEMLGGSLVAYSEPGEGTSIEIRVPWSPEGA
jgi:signal transduction histidine kinase